jgi:phospholipase C
MVSTRLRDRFGGRLVPPALAIAATVGLVTFTAAGQTVANGRRSAADTASPIKHLVVIFQENVSFDHYFGTYPKAANTSGVPFHAAYGTPSVNGLVNNPGVSGTGTLLTNNPNTDVTGTQVNPKRYDPATINDVLTCDQGHNYDAEQKAFNGGAMDKFVTTVGNGSGKSGTGQPCNAGDVMNYYDGNTVTGLWNYAQKFSMSDNSYNTTFGPSSPGALNLISGNTNPIDKAINGAPTNGETVSGTVIEDPQPYYDDCSTRDAVSLSGRNVGDNLNAAGISWGWFQGGFKPSTPFTVAATKIGVTTTTSVFTPDEFKGKGFNTPPASDQGICNTAHPVGAGIGGTGTGSTNYGSKNDYIPHHEPFQYYASTANPHHLAPASLSAIGTDTQSFAGGAPQFDTANHNYGMSDFNSLVGAITRGYISPDRLPAVSFLKAPGYQDGHAGYSDPIDEQQFVAQEIDALQQTPDWSSTAVVVSYDDSDGWYDHVYSGIHNTSNTIGASVGPQDFLTGTGLCGDTTANPPLGGVNGRCGYGPRLPLLVISPWAKHNFVDHTLTDQSSILAFVEQNWHLPKIANSFDAIAGSLSNLFDFNQDNSDSKLFLDPTTGQPFDKNMSH